MFYAILYLPILRVGESNLLIVEGAVDLTKFLAGPKFKERRPDRGQNLRS
jgi:hypothetical protein